MAREVLRALAAQAAAKLHGVNLDLVLRHAGRGRRDRQSGLGVLRGSPDLQRVTLQPGRADHGLHGGVRQIGREVLGLVHLAGAGQRLHGVAVVAGHSQFVLHHAGLEIRHDGRTGEGAVLAGVPVNGHFAQRLFSAPPVVCHHRHKLTEVEHLHNAAAVLHLGRVHAFDTAVEHRTSGHCGVQHARQLRVNTVTNLAGDDGRNVHPGNRLADDFPVLGVFEFDFFGRLQLGGGRGQLAVTQRTLAGQVLDPAQRRAAFGSRHAPALRGSRHQHVAGGATGLAQVRLRVADGAAADRGHVAVHPLLPQVVVRGGVFDADFLPIGVQLLGHHHGRGGAAALAHLGAGIADDDGVVGLDLDPGIQTGRVGGICFFRQVKSQAEAGGGGGGDLQEVAAVQAGGGGQGFHARTPLAATA